MEVSSVWLASLEPSTQSVIRLRNAQLQFDRQAYVTERYPRVSRNFSLSSLQMRETPSNSFSISRLIKRGPSPAGNNGILKNIGRGPLLPVTRVSLIYARRYFTFVLAGPRNKGWRSVARMGARIFYVTWKNVRLIKAIQHDTPYCTETGLVSSKGQLEIVLLVRETHLGVSSSGCGCSLTLRLREISFGDVSSMAVRTFALIRTYLEQ